MSGAAGRQRYKKSPLRRVYAAADLGQPGTGQHPPLRVGVWVLPKIFAPKPGVVAFNPGAGGHGSIYAAPEFVLICGKGAGFNSVKEVG